MVCVQTERETRAEDRSLTLGIAGQSQKRLRRYEMEPPGTYTSRMTISDTTVRAIAFGRCSVCRLILGATDELQQGVVIKTYSLNTTFPVDNVLPSESYYIKSK